MDDIINYITCHQFIIGVCAFIAILIIFFLFKKLIKLVLLFILVLIIFGGYLCFKDPERMPKNIIKSLQKTKEATRSVVEKGRGIYNSAKGAYKKAEKLVTRDIDKYLEPENKLTREK